MDGKFVSDWVQTRDISWGNFIVDTVMKNQFPPGFSAPLRAERIFAGPAVFDRPPALESGAALTREFHSLIETPTGWSAGL